MRFCVLYTELSADTNEAPSPSFTGWETGLVIPNQIAWVAGQATSFMRQLPHFPLHFRQPGNHIAPLYR